MRLAVAQFRREGAVAPQLEEALHRARAESVDLLVLPELALNGALPPEALAAVAEPSDGPAALALAEMARASGVAVLAGHAEHCTGKTYSALLLVDGDGHALANYRRTHLRGDEAPALARGQWLTGMRHAGWTLGILGGWDLMFPEVARSLVLAGVDLLLVAGSPRDDPARLATLAMARAIENGVPVAVAVWSRDGAGASALVVDAEGNSCAAFGSHHELAVAVLEPAVSRAAALAERRPRLYQRLVVAEGVDATPPS